jgi:hypothetical protein
MRPQIRESVTALTLALSVVSCHRPPVGVRREMFNGPVGRRWSEVVMSILAREWEQCRSLRAKQ